MPTIFESSPISNNSPFLCGRYEIIKVLALRLAGVLQHQKRAQWFASPNGDIHCWPSLQRIKRWTPVGNDWIKLGIRMVKGSISEQIYYIPSLGWRIDSFERAITLNEQIINFNKWFCLILSIDKQIDWLYWLNWRDNYFCILSYNSSSFIALFFPHNIMYNIIKFYLF